MSNVVTYQDMIDDHEITAELIHLADKPYSPRWGELIDTFGEGKLIELGADL